MKTETNRIKELLGKTFTKVYKVDKYELIFENDDEKVIMAHEQECCEVVELIDYTGELDWLVGLPILQADEVKQQADESDVQTHGYDDDSSGTWTFYKISTNRGTVDLRWLGISNGCYSESVDFNVEQKN